MKGKVTVPSRVQEHFLAYINPREAAMLRAMGGGVSKDGGQKMMNGVPFFSDADEEGGPGFDVADVTGPEATEPDDSASMPAFEPYDVPTPSSPANEGGGGIMSLVSDFFNKGVGGIVGDRLGLTPQASGALQALGGLGSIVMGGPGLISGAANMFQGANRALDLDITETDPFETDEQEMYIGGDK